MGRQHLNTVEQHNVCEMDKWVYIVRVWYVVCVCECRCVCMCVSRYVNVCVCIRVSKRVGLSECM